MLALTNKRSRLLVGPDLVLPKIHRGLTKQFNVIVRNYRYYHLQSTFTQF